jgi:hypothetical protein
MQGKRLCELLCGHLSAGGAPECATTCELLRPGSSAEAVTFIGNCGPKEISSWKDDRVQRRSVWKSLRVRCLKSTESLIGEGKHRTIIYVGDRGDVLGVERFGASAPGAIVVM